MASKQKTHRVCVICGTRERHCGEKLFFAKFPADENRCRQWLKAVGDEDLVHLPIEKLAHLRHVCGKHFKRKDFTKTGSRIKKSAVPNLNLTGKSLTEVSFENFPLHITNETLPTQQQNEDLSVDQPSVSQLCQSEINLYSPSTSNNRHDRTAMDFHRRHSLIFIQYILFGRCSHVSDQFDICQNNFQACLRKVLLIVVADSENAYNSYQTAVCSSFIICVCVCRKPFYFIIFKTNLLQDKFQFQYLSNNLCIFNISSLFGLTLVGAICGLKRFVAAETLGLLYQFSDVVIKDALLLLAATKIGIPEFLYSMLPLNLISKKSLQSKYCHTCMRRCCP